jgi:tetratricopeptide (TPR) repeat protein
LAENWLRRSIQSDPKLARAHVRLARLLAGRCWSGNSTDVERELRESEQLAERALVLDDRDPECYFAVSILALMGRQHKRALSTAQRAIDLNQNFPLGFFALGETRVFMGQFAEALEPLARCIELSPTEPFTAYFLSFASLAHYHLCDYDEAIRYSELALYKRQSHLLLRTMLAGLGQTGRTEEARAALIKIDRERPANFKRYWQLTCPYADPTHEAHLIEGLQKAGYTFPV